MNETEELKFIKENLKEIVGLDKLPNCQCSESSQEVKKESSYAASGVDKNVKTIDLAPLQNFIQTQIKEFYIDNNINADEKSMLSKQENDSNYTENKSSLNIISKSLKASLNNAVKSMHNQNYAVICKIQQNNIGYDSYLKDLIQKLDYEDEVCDNKDLVIIDQVDSNLIDDNILQQEDNKHYPVLKSNLVTDTIERNVKNKCVSIGKQTKNDSTSGVNVILGILNQDTSEPVDVPKNNEPVKQYMLPFVSEDKMENKDNADPGWNYLKALDTDEERYKFVRKCWKSLVVPDPNVNLTYHGYLRRRQRVKGVLKEPGWPNNKTHLLEMSAKRKRSADDEDDDIGNPKKRRQCTLNTNFSTKRIDKAMLAVTENYREDSNKRLNAFQADKLKKTYDEKINALVSARGEVLMLHKFYSGLPDQNMSISQQDLENEQFDIEQLYDRFKKHYKWDGRQFFP